MRQLKLALVSLVLGGCAMSEPVSTPSPTPSEGAATMPTDPTPPSAPSANDGKTSGSKKPGPKNDQGEDDNEIPGDDGDDAAIAACDACFSQPEARVCTKAGDVAWNACAASACLGSSVDHPGDCKTPASCSAAGGVCTFTSGSTSPCPDGTSWEVMEPTQGCGGGNYEVRCCKPSGLACTYFGGASIGLSMNPFTCGGTSVCISGVQSNSCSYDADISPDAQSAPWDAAVTIEAGTNRSVKITGVDNATGKTFTCTGVAADEWGWAPTTLTCTTCDAGGGGCQTCSVVHDGLCKL